MKFSDKQVYEAAVRVVNAKGEDYEYFVGDGCSYAKGGEPSCLVGHIVYDLDPRLFEKLEAEEEDRRDTIEDTMVECMTTLQEAFSGKQIRALRIAQFEQDLGSTWGTAFLAFSRLDQTDDSREE